MVHVFDWFKRLNLHADTWRHNTLLTSKWTSDLHSQILKGECDGLHGLVEKVFTACVIYIIRYRGCAAVFAQAKCVIEEPRTYEHPSSLCHILFQYCSGCMLGHDCLPAPPPL